MNLFNQANPIEIKDLFFKGGLNTDKSCLDPVLLFSYLLCFLVFLISLLSSVCILFLPRPPVQAPPQCAGVYTYIMSSDSLQTPVQISH